MATIQNPGIAFTSIAQNRVRISFNVKFTNTELAGRVASSWIGRYANLNQPHLPPTYSYSAKVLFKVIRIVPQPFVSGSPPPPLPDPVVLNVTTLSVPLPTSGNVKSLSTEFGYTLGVDNDLVFDHLHAEVMLFRRYTLLPTVFNFPIESRTSNDLVLTMSDLASPQPNGVVIP